MNKIYKLLSFIFVFCLFTLSALAEVSKTTDNSTISVYYDGDSEYIAKIDIKKDWHIYWSNPGEIGKPTTISTSEGNIKVINSSNPTVVKAFGTFDEFIYKNSAFFHFKLTDADNGILSFNFVECNDVCKENSISFPVNSITKSSDILWNNFFEQANETFSQKIEVSNSNNQNTINIKDIKFSDNIRFIPTFSHIIDEKSIKISANENNNLQISWKNLPTEINSENINKLKQAILITPDKTYAIDISYDNNFWHLVTMIILSFVGGILLNAMPCVFPVLSLKIFSIIKNKDNSHNIRNAVLYTLGVLFSFLVLTFILILLKKQGEAVGWGFQLQSPLFVGIMAFIFFILFLMNAEIIRFPNFASGILYKMSGANSFATGFFSVLIASPCTGPFMGATIGYAFMQTPVEIYAIFSALAIGYALPYALIELFPQKISKLMPKPGSWMKTLKNVLSIPLLITAIWLSSILTTQLKFADNANNALWLEYDSAKIQSLVAQKQKVFIDFTADWCLSCKYHDKFILNSQEFIDFAKNNNVFLFKADLTKNNHHYYEELRKYGRQSIPAFVYYQDGNYKLLPLFFNVSDIKE